MPIKSLIVFTSILFLGCGSKVEIPNLDFEEWRNSKICTEYRIQGALRMQEEEDHFLNIIQPTIENILGKTSKHELSKRSEKFFYYPISLNCSDSIPNQSLLFRFDALGRVKEVLVVLD